MICPYCNKYIQFIANIVKQSTTTITSYSKNEIRPNWIEVGRCPNPTCNRIIINLKFTLDDVNNVQEKVIFPSSSTAPMPIPEMPDEIKQDYMEARDVVDASPRSALALLRLCTEKLLNHLGAKKDKLNEKIGELVERGDISNQTAKALDILRVFGNNAVHPLKTTPTDYETAIKVFKVLNFVVDKMIVEIQEFNDLYDDNLSDSIKNSIAKRDSKTK